MTDEIPVQALVAMATVCGAFIAGMISFVTLVLNKEQKTSEFRQAWIDGLREDLSVFLAGLRTIAKSEAIFYKQGGQISDINFPPSAEQIQERRMRAMEALFRIKLRLNTTEADHVELLRLLERVLEEQGKIVHDKPDAEPSLRAIDLAAEYSRPVLKAEWDRVKAGEPAFRLARNWIVPLIIGLSIVFIVVVFRTHYREDPPAARTSGPVQAPLHADPH